MDLNKLLRLGAVLGMVAWVGAGCSLMQEAKDIAPDARVAVFQAPAKTLDLKAVPHGVYVLGVAEEAPRPVGGMVGLSLAFGDFNGDGKADLAIGAPSFPDFRAVGQTPPEPGGVYLLFGRTSLPTLNELPAQADLIFVAQTTSAGYRVAFGDLNGDGLDDLIVGAPWGAGFVPLRRHREGVVAVIFGRRDFAGTHSLGATADLLISGARSDDFAGAALDAGDFNGDGLEDLLIGAPMDTALGTFERANAGAAYLLFGRRQWPKTLDLATEASVTLHGVARSDRTGTAVALSDVTGDGLADAIVGAPLADWYADVERVERKKKDCGAVYLVTGRKEIADRVDLATEADSTIYGTENGDGAGWAVVTGDFNGDGMADVVIGAPLARHQNVRRKNNIYDLIGGNTRADLGLSAARTRVSGHAEGEVYLLWGRASWPAELDLANRASVTLYGPSFEESSEVYIIRQGGGDAGFAMAMGDVNGDGRLDLLVGSPFEDGAAPYRKDAGMVHVVLGTDRLRGTQGLARLSEHLVVGSNEGYRLGTAIAAGDFDGDGKAEFALAEPRAAGLDSERSVRGRVYLIERLPVRANAEGAPIKMRPLRKPTLP